MTDENRKLLARINEYAETVLAGINPQKVQVSAQLEKLKPVMEEIARERNTSVEEIFILYMDLQSEASLAADQKLREELSDIEQEDGQNTFLFR